MPTYSAGERRQAPRRRAQCDVRLQVSVAFLDAEARGESGIPPMTLLGQTRDISASGLAFVLPSIRIDERNCVDRWQGLQIVLDLPNSSVRLRAVPAYCRRLDEREPDRGYLIGAEVTSMDDDEHGRLIEYLNTGAGS